MNKKQMGLLVILVVLAGVFVTRRYAANKPQVDRSTEKVSDARAVDALKRADAACRNVTAATFDASFRGEGVMAAREPGMKGSVLFNADKHWIRATGTIVGKDGTESKFDNASDGEHVFAVDYARKAFAHGENAFEGVLLNPGAKLFMPELQVDDPFTTELKGQATYEGLQDVEGEPCEVVRVLYRRGELVRWYFSKRDALPRRVERIYNRLASTDERDKTIYTISNLNVAPSLALAQFQITAPEGFEAIEMKMPEPLLAAGTKAPEWELATQEEAKVRLADLRGDVVVLDFWATWCGPCKMVMPKIEALHQELKDRHVRVFGVSCMEQPGGDPYAYMQSKDYTYGLLINGDEVARRYKVFAIPSIYVIDAEGTIVYSFAGAGNEEALKAAVLAAVEKLET